MLQHRSFKVFFVFKFVPITFNFNMCRATIIEITPHPGLRKIDQPLISTTTLHGKKDETLISVVFLYIQ